MFFSVFLDAVWDTLRMLPFLFVAYLFIEYLEHRGGEKMERWLARGGHWGFAPAAVLGAVPQCGFSAMAANLYGSRVVSLGTLMAVFLATSDEAIPIMLTQPKSYSALLALVLTKLLYALLVGFLLDIPLRRALPNALRGGFAGSIHEVDCHEHEEKQNWALAALRHTAITAAILLLFTFAFGLLVAGIGEETLRRGLANLGFFQPVMAGLLGLVPNCAASVMLTQLYLEGGLSFGSVLAGLCCNAGIGLTVLFRANKNLRQNLFIVALLFVLGVGLGLLVHGVGQFGFFQFPLPATGPLGQGH